MKDLIALLAATPIEVARLINELPAATVVVKSSVDEFSILENVCHLRDLEIEGYAVRIQRILSEDCPTLADFDGTRVALERDYNKQSLTEALAGFTLARRRNLVQVEALTDEQFDRVGSMAGVGEISLRRLLEMMLEHDEGHLDDLRRSCRLAKSASSDL